MHLLLIHDLLHHALAVRVLVSVHIRLESLRASIQVSVKLHWHQGSHLTEGTTESVFTFARATHRSGRASCALMSTIFLFNLFDEIGHLLDHRCLARLLRLLLQFDSLCLLTLRTDIRVVSIELAIEAHHSFVL